MGNDQERHPSSQSKRCQSEMRTRGQYDLGLRFLTLCLVPPASCSISVTEASVLWPQVHERLYSILLKPKVPKFK